MRANERGGAGGCALIRINMHRCKRRCLVLGPQGSGKSLLVKKLSRLSRSRQDNGGQEKEMAEYVPTKPTNGVSVEELHLGKNATLLVKEYGGAMAPVWSGAYADCDSVVYVIDATNCTQISASTILLLEVLDHEEIKKKPFLLVFNKLDRHCPMSLNQYKSVMRLDDILRCSKQNITTLEGSCMALGSYGLVTNVWEWMNRTLS